MFADRTATIDVDRTALPEGVTPETVTLQQFVPNRSTWEPVALQLVDESATQYRFEADLQRFETLAVTAPERTLELVTLDLSATTLDVDETASVDVAAAFRDGATDIVTLNATVTSRDPEIARVERASSSEVSVVGVGSGETTLVANVTVGNKVVTATQPITVRTSDDTTDDETSSGGGGGGTRSASRADVTADQPAESTQSQAYTVTLRNVYSGQQVVADATTEQATTGFVTPSVDTWPPMETTADTPTPATSATRNVLSDGLVLTVADQGDYELDVSARDVDVFTENVTAMNDTPPADAVDRSTAAFGAAGRQFVDATAQRPIGFITVTHNLETDDLETATHRFRVRNSYLAATNATVESVTLYRTETDGYRALPTRMVGSDGTFHYFEAETPGFSTFVVGTDAPVFDLGNATLTAVNETDGQVEATVPVENVGTQTGTYTVRLRGDGTVLATTTITVPPGETATASVQTTMPDADGVTLSLAGQSIGELTVTETAESTEPAATPTDDDALPVLPSFILILLLVVLGVILGWLSRQTTEDDDS